MKKLLGIDFGTKYIGLALATDNKFISDLETIKYKESSLTNYNETLQKISTLIKVEYIEKIVIGYPKSSKPNSPIIKKINKFTINLAKMLSPYNCEIIYQDESHTSKAAIDEMLTKGVSKKNRSNDHAFSASQIIKRYFEEN